MARKMTLAQAVKFVEEAQKRPVDEIDREKLVEAIKAIAAESQRNFLERAARQIGEAPVDLDDALGEIRIGSDNPFLPGADRVLQDAFAKAHDVLNRVVSSDAGPEQTRAIKPEAVEPAGPGRERAISGSAEGAAGVVSASPGTVGGIPGREPSSASAAAATRLPSDLLGRFYKAAKTAGVPTSEANAILEEAEAGGGGTRQFPHPLTGEPMSVDTEGEDPVAVVEGWIEEWTQGAIGVQPGFFAIRPEEFGASKRRKPGRGDMGPAPERMTDVAPQYFEGDQYNMAGLPSETIVKMQGQLEAAGLIGVGSAFGEYYAGVWDEASSSAMFSIMGMANQQGRDIDTVIEDLQANVPASVKEARNQAQLVKQFQAPGYVEPDYATLAQDVKSTMRNRLGREPTEQEMAELTGVMSNVYRADFEADVAVMRAEFDAQQQGLETGTYGAPGSFQDIDPLARFGQEFDTRFGPELDFVDERADQVRNADNVFESLRTMSALVGGR